MPRFVIVGNGSLLLQCAEALEARGHSIQAVVGPAHLTRWWADERGIPFLREPEDLAGDSRIGPIDLILSIGYLKPIPPAVLALARLGGINFHDGPLPRYGGLNVPAWAIIQGEESHGITWHRMVAQLDAGEILVTRSFPVSPTETAFTLNAKCFAAALESFDELMDRIEAGRLEGTPQEGRPHIFRRKDRPDGACGIRWADPAARIHALIRGLDFGPYVNPLGLPATWWNGHRLVPLGAESLADAAGSPGGTARRSEGGLRVTTGTEDLLLTRVRLEDGRIVAGDQAADLLGLPDGARLQEPSDRELAWWRETIARSAAQEDFWLARLTQAKPTALAVTEAEAADPEPVELRFDIPARLSELGAEPDPGTVALGLTIASLGVVLGRSRIDFQFSHAGLPAPPGERELRWFASEVPASLSLLPGDRPAEMAARLGGVLGRVRQAGTFPLDLPARSPELRSRGAIRFDLGAILGGPARMLPGSALTIQVDENGLGAVWLADRRRLDPEAVAQWRDACQRVLLDACSDPIQAFGSRPAWANPRVRARYGLSPTQAGMLYHQLRAEEPGIDVEQIVATLSEEIEPRQLEQAWRLIVQRHDVLRTRFRWEESDEPVQEVLATVPLDFASVDWRDRSESDQVTGLEQYLVSDRARGFDLSAPPLFRVALFRTGEAHWRMVWSFAHIILDGTSFPIVLEELFEALEALRRGTDPKWLFPVPYHRFIDWLAGRDIAADQRFWRTRLHDFTTPTPLPAGDRAGGSGIGQREARLGKDLSEALLHAGTQFGFRLVTAVLGAWGMVLGRFAGSQDVVFGAARSCRRGSLQDGDRIVGLLINTLPVRVSLPLDQTVGEWLIGLREEQAACRSHEHAPLAEVQQQSGVPPGKPLFNSLVVYDHRSLEHQLRSLGGAWSSRSFDLRERTGFPLTLHAYGEPEMTFRLAYERERVSDQVAEQMLDLLLLLLKAFAENPRARISDLPRIIGSDQEELLKQWNSTQRPVVVDCVHRLISAQAGRTPERIALVAGSERISYRELDRRANRLARILAESGVGPDQRVGLAIGRQTGLVVAMLGIQKAGGAYVPLDPSYPRERLEYMLTDSGARVVVTDRRNRGRFFTGEAILIQIEDVAEAGDDLPFDGGAGPGNLAYVMYTSGSTGRPKGVMVEHRNVANFFAGMDDRLGPESGTWLAVTSPSFDISVLELAWTLARGFTVVLAAMDQPVALDGTRGAAPRRPVTFSLFYFASGESSAGDGYRLLLEGARFADQHGFEAVWTPERHFHAFGGLYPNPSVAAAALAVATERISIRAGSVVLPLHHPIRVAEEWALVDNLSGGRVGISFASGWQPNDFVLRPESFERQKEVMMQGIDTVRRLWRGETLPFPGPRGEVEIRTLPRPVQPELPFWITTAGNPESFEAAGKAGARLLTHLLGQSLDELAAKLARYREAWKAAGHPGEGHVTLMLHTFVGDSAPAVRETVRGPLIEYLRSSASLIRHYAWAFPAFRKRSGADTEAVDLASLSEEELEGILDHAFDRYYETSGLFGTVEGVLPMVDRVRSVGVDEIACLIDFGVPADQVLRHLEDLDQVRQLATRETEDRSISAELIRHRVTHLQCTPVLARVLADQPQAHPGLRGLRHLLVGGEAFPSDLAGRLAALLGEGSQLHNMYGPTETTIWSTSHRVAPESGPGSTVPLGRPIANTRVYVLDEGGNPVPAGVAGELWIAGAGVARGYLNQPELTAQRFLPDRFGGEGMMYRTGDLVRWRADGTLEFLGRGDDQIKLRGFRIELGEIESALRQVAPVRDSVVVSRGTGEDQRLVAYLVGNGSPLDPDAVRSRLRERLPEFMIPSQFVRLDDLPLTPNGKVDRKALPDPQAIAGAAEPDHREEGRTAPPTELETEIARIWKEVLRVPSVGLDENFFDLGGHSLLAVQAHRRLREALGDGITLTMLFQFPTVRHLAAHLGGGRSSRLDESSARAAGRREALSRRAGARRSRKP